MRRLDTRGIVGLAGALLLVLLVADQACAAGAPRLRYGFQSGKQYGYDIKIVAKFQGIEATREGILVFDVPSATDDQFVTKSSGMLTLKATGHMFGGPEPDSPFVRFAISRESEMPRPEGWTLSRNGSPILVGNNEQLPYLLGPQELLIIEPLPAGAEVTWSNNRDTRVVEMSLGRAGWSNGWPLEVDKKGHVATERTEYAVVKTTPESVFLSKKYTLSTASAGNSAAQCTVSGKGELEFDRKRGVFRSNSTRYEIQIAEPNVKMTLPVTLAYRLLTETELADRQKQEKAAAKAEAKARERKALSAGERVALLKDLRSGDERRVRAALERLGRAIADEQSEQVSAAVVPLLGYPDEWIQAEAAKALAVWATPQAESALIEASRDENWMVRGAALEALGRIPSQAAAEAAVAQIWTDRDGAGKALRAMGGIAEAATIPLLVDHDLWVRKEACEVLKAIGGQASLVALQQEASKARDLDRRDFDRAIATIKYRLAAEGKEVKKPATPEAAKAVAKTVRIWRDATGTFEVEAAFVARTGDTITLRRKDGRAIRVPIDQLSEEDQAWVETRSKAVNPFE